MGSRMVLHFFEFLAVMLLVVNSFLCLFLQDHKNNLNNPSSKQTSLTMTIDNAYKKQAVFLTNQAETAKYDYSSWRIFT